MRFLCVLIVSGHPFDELRFTIITYLSAKMSFQLFENFFCPFFLQIAITLNRLCEKKKNFFFNGENSIALYLNY